MILDTDEGIWRMDESKMVLTTIISSLPRKTQILKVSSSQEEPDLFIVCWMPAD